MLNPFLKVEWLKEGRNVRLPMIIIFYNAILAFITILFMFFNAESLQEGYSYNTSSYLYQFLIISTFQIGMIFVLMPFSVWGFYATDRHRNALKGVAIISTNKGVVTDKEARSMNVGGEVLAFVW